jgi:hypothetical protein
MMPHGIFGLTFDPKVDLGHFLTFLTLAAGFFWWLYTGIRSRRKVAEDEARSGAARLLLKLLRDRGMAAPMEALYAEFNSPNLSAQRKAYCRRDWKFKDMTQFEALVYRLDFEGKIDFPSGNEIAFRLDHNDSRGPRFYPSEADKSKLLEIFEQAIPSKEVNIWDLEKLAEASMRANPKETALVISKELQNTNAVVQRRAAGIAGKLMPEIPKSAGAVV